VPDDWPGGVRRVGGVIPVGGVCAERGKAEADSHAPVGVWRGSALDGWTPKMLSTDAVSAGGPARSSGEVPVMGVERRGWLIWMVCSREQPRRWLWEETSEQNRLGR
jgi:hypothetical protein